MYECPIQSSGDREVDLPDEYQQVEYIESTGTQYINTGVYADENVAIECELKVLTESNNVDYSGAVYSGLVGWCAFGGYGSNKLGAYFSTGSRAGVEIPFDKNFHKYTLKNGLQKIDNTSATNTVTSLPSSGNKMLLFLFTGNIDFIQTFNNKQAIRYCKIWYRNVLVRNYIPCYRKSDNVIGMYDTVNNVFYTNAGTGTFLKGKDVGVINTKVENKNLFNPDGEFENGYYNTDGSFMSSLSWRCMTVNCKAGDKFIKTGAKWGGNTTFWNDETFVSGLNGSAVTIPNGANKVKFALQYPFNGDEQLEQGTTATAYTPHAEQNFTLPVQQPMRSIGTTRDVFFKNVVGSEYYNAELVEGVWYERHPIYRKIFDGTENWALYDSNKFRTWVDEAVYPNNDALCNTYIIEPISISDMVNGNFRISPTSNRNAIFFKNTNYNTAEDWKAYLAEQYANGTPVYADYELATPTYLLCTQEQVEVLESIVKAKSYYEQTNISSPDEVSPVYDVEAYQDENLVINEINQAIVALGGV